LATVMEAERSPRGEDSMWRTLDMVVGSLLGWGEDGGWAVRIS
jgi:hypothetical protein